MKCPLTIVVMCFVAAECRRGPPLYIKCAEEVELPQETIETLKTTFARPSGPPRERPSREQLYAMIQEKKNLARAIITDPDQLAAFEKCVEEMRRKIWGAIASAPTASPDTTTEAASARRR